MRSRKSFLFDAIFLIQRDGAGAWVMGQLAQDRHCVRDDRRAIFLYADNELAIQSESLPRVKIRLRSCEVLIK
jgi:hypothetical protein